MSSSLNGFQFCLKRGINCTVGWNNNLREDGGGLGRKSFTLILKYVQSSYHRDGLTKQP